MRLATLLIGGLLTGSCLFTSVGENLEQQSCVGESRSFCQELNELAPTGDDCQEWSCDVGDGVCKILPRDSDGDGTPAMECVPSGVVGDCDDDDVNRRPFERDGGEVAEKCDGVDNDCDGLVDEGAYSLEFATEIIEGTVEHLSVAQNDDLVSTFLYSDGSAVMTAKAGEGVARSVLFGEPAAGFPVQSSALLHLPNKGFIAAAGRDDGARQLRIGRLDAQTLDGVESNVQTLVSSLAVAAGVGSSDYLGAYIENNIKVNDSCGGFADGLPRPVLLFRGSVSDTETTVEAEVLDLGLTRSPSAVAVIGASSNTWLVASTDDDKAVNLHLIAASHFPDNPPAPINTRVAEFEPGDVSLAMNDDGTQVAMAYREGCGNATKLRLALFARDGDTLTEQSTQLLPSGDEGRRPKLLWRASPSPGWLVSWEEANQRLKLGWLSEDGAFQGAPYELLSASGVRSGAHLTYGENDGIVIFATSNTGLHQIELSCTQ